MGKITLFKYHRLLFGGIMVLEFKNEQDLYSKFNYNPELRFKNCGSQPKVDINGAKLKNLQADTVEISKKKGLSKKAKIMLSIAGLAALIGIGIIAKKKIDAKKITQLAEHIDFKEATTLEEAIEFGKQNLGIKEYVGFEPENLDVVNWANEGLVNVNNKMKGKAVMPKIIKYADEIGKTGRADASMSTDGVMKISKSVVERVKSGVSKYCAKKENLPPDELDKMVEKINSSYKYALSYLRKHSSNRLELEGKFDVADLSEFTDIYHEMGHLQHSSNIGLNLYRQMCDYNSSETALSNKTRRLFSLFNKFKPTIEKNISDYATTNPAEFVAEVFSGLCGGMKFENNIMDLYKKLGGVII